MATALYRLAILESQPIRNPNELLEWDRLRKWVLSDDRLLQQYREQRYFTCADEITKNDIGNILNHLRNIPLIFRVYF